MAFIYDKTCVSQLVKVPAHPKTQGPLRNGIAVSKTPVQVHHLSGHKWEVFQQSAGFLWFPSDTLWFPHTIMVVCIMQDEARNTYQINVTKKIFIPPVLGMFCRHCDKM